MDSQDKPRESSRRSRRKTSRFEFDEMDNEEQRMIQQAIKNSKRETRRAEMSVPDAPVFYPTMEEFKNPFQYINKIRPEAELYGICKIVPPTGWNPPCLVDMSNPQKFPTKLQQVNTLQESKGFDDGKNYDIAEYKIMADKFYRQWSEKYYDGSEVPLDLLAKDYWDAVETQTKTMAVEYGNDIDTQTYGSGFSKKMEGSSGVEGSSRSGVTGARADSRSSTSSRSSSSSSSSSCSGSSGGDGDGDDEDMFTDAYYQRTGWNLNNLPAADGSLLKYLKTPFSGVNVPWLYVGMLFSSFCWHNEDNYLYSINYNHFGAIKQWYGCPGSEARNFEKVAKEFLTESFRENPDLLHHMDTQISPSLLLSQRVPVFQVKHDPKTFVITFPKSFHCGFSYGFNVGEAVNFATSDWIAAGSEAEEKYRRVPRGSVFSHQRLLFTLLHHKKEDSRVMLEPRFYADLLAEIIKVLDEEIDARPFIYGLGIRNITDQVKLPPNKFEAIDEDAADYDEMRTCHLCKHACVFSAVACECSRTSVSCIRHFHQHCGCAKDRKYMLEWGSTKDLKNLRSETKQQLAELRNPSKKTSAPSSSSSSSSSSSCSRSSASKTTATSPAPATCTTAPTAPSSASLPIVITTTTTLSATDETITEGTIADATMTLQQPIATVVATAMDVTLPATVADAVTISDTAGAIADTATTVLGVVTGAVWVATK